MRCCESPSSPVAAQFSIPSEKGALLLGNNVLNTITPEALDTVMAEQRTIVVYCDAKRCERSKKTAADMRELFGKDIYFLKGGWKTLQ